MTSHRRPRHARSSTPSLIDITLERPANGGASVGRDSDGRTVFCEGGLPGETVRVALHTEKKRFAKGTVVEVLDPSPHRQAAKCPAHHAGCGGCDLGHVSAAAQAEIKAHVVRDSLIRIGRLDIDAVDRAMAEMILHPLPSRYRTTARLAITNGRATYRMRASREVVAPETCLVVHEALEQLIVEGRFGDIAGPEVVLRVSDSTGERLALVDGSADAVDLPDDVVVVSRQQVRDGLHPSTTETAAGRSWQVGAASFFQAGPTVASALVEAVAVAAGDLADTTLVDAYSGIGLFSGTVGTSAVSTTAIERSGSSTIDARENLADANVKIVETSVEAWAATPADVVIADPARAGLGQDAVDALVRCNAERFVLVACDTGSLGRDVGLLTERGYQLETVQLVDAFHDTSHVETVVQLRR